MNIQPASALLIEKAANLLAEGRVVAFPTETVYGLGADATNDKAVAEIFSVKGRPRFNPLIVHVSSVAMARREVEWNIHASILAAAVWPGALTLVLPRRKNSRISLLVSAGGDTLAVRMPAHDAARELIEAAAVPLAAPSANRSGRISPTTALHVRDELQDAVPLILDGGACRVGLESSVLDLTGKEPLLLRAGGVPLEKIERMMGTRIATLKQKQEMLKSPGMLESHYAPNLPVRLNISAPLQDEALLAFGPHVPGGAKHVINLSEKADDKEAAARLFAALRELDRPDYYSGIAVMPIPDNGLGVAINDRLSRAAARG